MTATLVSWKYWQAYTIPGGGMWLEAEYILDTFFARVSVSRKDISGVWTTLGAGPTHLDAMPPEIAVLILDTDPVMWAHLQEAIEGARS